MAKIAVEMAGSSSVGERDSGGTAVRLLEAGDGWRAQEVVCARGPSDRPFEEQHENATIALVMAGTFQYRASGVAAGREMMMPGSLLLGNPGQQYECGHEHAVGDRCVSFQYTPAYFESIAADGGTRGTAGGFRHLKVPPMRLLSPIVAQVQAALAGAPGASWEELALRVAAQAVRLDGRAVPSRTPVSAAAIARVTETVRLIERRSDDELTLADLARAARLSPFHFLRTFEDLTGVTPHQYLMRTRLQKVATRLVLEPTKIVDLALDSGFGDASNFNRSFRAEFGVAPGAYRRRHSTAVASVVSKGDDRIDATRPCGR